MFRNHLSLKEREGGLCRSATAVAADMTAPALALLMQGVARALFDDLFGPALRAVRDGRIAWSDGSHTVGE